jgi:hypothetical protein
MLHECNIFLCAFSLCSRSCDSCLYKMHWMFSWVGTETTGLPCSFLLLVCTSSFCCLGALVLFLLNVNRTSNSMLRIRAEDAVGTLFEHQIPVWCSCTLLCFHNLLWEMWFLYAIQYLWGFWVLGRAIQIANRVINNWWNTEFFQVKDIETIIVSRCRYKFSIVCQDIKLRSAPSSCFNFSPLEDEESRSWWTYLGVATDGPYKFHKFLKMIYISFLAKVEKPAHNYQKRFLLWSIKSSCPNP